MRFVLFISLITIASSCTHNNASFKRGYVISHVHDSEEAASSDSEDEE